MAWQDKLFALPQYLLPQHALSRAIGILTNNRHQGLKNFLIRTFVRLYGIDLRDAVNSDLAGYQCFNEFFTRALRSEARPLASDPKSVLCPADGIISQIGNINGYTLLQAKGQYFSLLELLGGDAELAAPFHNGSFATIYLSPRDYHRLHMPMTGKLRAMIHIPGRLFGVNQATSHAVPHLFARNERVVAYFDTEAGPMALILVGAIFVASIETVWHGIVTPPSIALPRKWDYQDKNELLERGQEMGRFNMGSTILVLFGQSAVMWAAHLQVGDPIKMGQLLGQHR